MSKSDFGDGCDELKVQKDTMFENILRGLNEALADAKGEINLPRNIVEDNN